MTPNQSNGDIVVLSPGDVPLATWRRILRDAPQVSLATGARDRVVACHQAVADLIATDRPIYAVNTGFGKLASVRIAPNQLEELQRNLILSHAAGTGDLLSDDIVRLILVMKATALAQGFSGVGWELIDMLLVLANAGIYPCIPAKGSVGASGDLAPLSHMAAVLLGLGEVRIDGRIFPGAEGLARCGLVPLKFGPKEGVALINGTQVSTALALFGLFQAEDVLRAALVTGSLAVEAARGDNSPFDARIQAVRRHRGQEDVAAVYRTLLAGSPIREANRATLKVQDPYCLRCQPQVMGACLDNLRYSGSVLGIEANAVSDNPLVFPEDGEVLSGGNFHAEPVAFAADIIALSLCEIGSLCERRQALLVDASLSGLPAFLIEGSGLNSGFHDGAGDGRRVGQREQDAGTSGKHRFDSDVRQSGRPRLDVLPRRLSFGANGGECRDRGGVGVAACGTGNGFSQAAVPATSTRRSGAAVAGRSPIHRSRPIYRNRYCRRQAVAA